MTVQLLPSDYDERIREAVRSFWRTRQSPGPGKQVGSFGNNFNNRTEEGGRDGGAARSIVRVIG